MRKEGRQEEMKKGKEGGRGREGRKEGLPSKAISLPCSHRMCQTELLFVSETDLFVLFLLQKKIKK